MNSETWVVTHAGSAYVAKRVAASDLPQLAAGCDVAARLAEAGLVTGAPVPTRDGQLVVADHALALLEFVPGRELDGRSDEEQRWIADTLSRVHSLGGPAAELGTGTSFEWLGPDAPGGPSYTTLLRLSCTSPAAPLRSWARTAPAAHSDPRS
ncbi:MAG: phosphotransferase [Nakamurella sp.]